MTLERLIATAASTPPASRKRGRWRSAAASGTLEMGGRARGYGGGHPRHPSRHRGAAKFRTSFGQNVLNHSGGFLSGPAVGGEMGVNATPTRAPGALHRQAPGPRGSHIQIGVEIARKYKENPAVIHVPSRHTTAMWSPRSWPSSAGRPMHQRLGARRENLESYIKRLENLEEISCSFEGVGVFAGAREGGREVRIMGKPTRHSVLSRHPPARSITKKIEEGAGLPRPDEGERDPREPRGGIRQVIFQPYNESRKLSPGAFLSQKEPACRGIFPAGRFLFALILRNPISPGSPDRRRNPRGCGLGWGPACRVAFRCAQGHRVWRRGPRVGRWG